MSVELKPCPFCGNVPSMETRTNYQHYSAAEAQRDGMGVSGGSFTIKSWELACACGIRIPTSNDVTLASRWNIRATQPPAVGVDVIELNDDTIDILGRPNFACGSIARTLRLRGDDIPNRAENEQAATIAFLLGHYFASGTGWRASATEELSRITSQRVTAALRTGGGES